MQVACRLESNLYARDPIWMSGSLSADCNSSGRFLAHAGSGPVVRPFVGGLKWCARFPESDGVSESAKEGQFTWKLLLKVRVHILLQTKPLVYSYLGLVSSVSLMTHP